MTVKDFMTVKNWFISVRYDCSTQIDARQICTVYLLSKTIN